MRETRLLGWKDTVGRSELKKNIEPRERCKSWIIGKNTLTATEKKTLTRTAKLLGASMVMLTHKKQMFIRQKQRMEALCFFF